MQILKQIQQDFSEYLTNHTFENNPPELYQPINYILSIGGKRLRPASLLLACYLFEGKYQQALPAAYAIEVFHNFTLVHDDIMDEAPLRRGNPTVHQRYGTNVGILSGDVMMVHAFNALLEMKNVPLIKIMKVFARQAVEVCEGQQMDMNFEQQEEVSISEYLKMIELKTSVLVGAAMKIGALIGGASEADAENTYEFGRNLGIAFQLQDDLLDTYGNPEKFGKKVGGDIVQNKKTILFLKALEQASPALKNDLQGLYARQEIPEAEKIARVIAIFDQLGVKSQTEQMQEMFKDRAFESLEKIDAPAERKELLQNFGYGLLRREV